MLVRPSCSLLIAVTVALAQTAVAQTVKPAGNRLSNDHNVRPTCGPSTGADCEAAFHRWVDVYFHEYFRHHPTEATPAGLHQYDRCLEDHSRAGTEAKVNMLKRFAAQCEQFHP